MIKVVVILGPTASGKSEFAVRLAKKIHGEVISADSRQVYRGLDLGSGKVTGRAVGNKFVYKGVVHWGIDIASPLRQFSVAQFKNYAQKAIVDVSRRGKTPILCGGTGHWIDAVIFDQSIPEVKPNSQLRKKLEKQSVSALYKQLQKLDPERAKTIDRHNPRRLIRALEIVMTTGSPVPSQKQTPRYEVAWIGITHPQEVLNKKIEQRLKQRLKQGLIKEVKNLHSKGLSWHRLESFGLEYKYIALHLQNKLTHDQMFTELLSAIKHYSKRQMTWFKRNKQIEWIKKDDADALAQTSSYRINPK